MRNYSEIGCLTLLGVTLTVYVAVGSCQPGTDMSDWSRKNINAEPVEKSVTLNRSGKHYVFRVSAKTSQKGNENPVQKNSTINIQGSSDLLDFTSLPQNNSFLSLPVVVGYTNPGRMLISDIKPFDVSFFKSLHPASYAEIRAGPFQI
ncbi:hypothetical protein [Marinilabilia rubra]|uniref:hypothetical protein n=1 Tax=Marinilabilia rubra TaxID=2162893 RepID=UPI0011B28A43|nr:hypothetical protein [Marinilabilia rubra]